jgi:mevalonate kinase
MNQPKLVSEIGSAHGKFIVLGEHSILYGGQALVYPIKELNLTMSLSANGKGPLLGGKPLDRWQIEKLRSVLTAMGIDVDLGMIAITGEIPIGKGLGSSAALCVAVARYFFPEATPTAIAKLAKIGEGVFHGTSSGADPFAISIERPIVFKMEGNEFRPLNLSNASDFVFLLRDSGAEHSTSEVIKQVSELRQNRPAQFNSIMDRLKVNTGLGLKMIEAGQFDRLGLLIQDSNRLLFEMGLGNAALENAIESLLIEGALGAKMTGAGLGGYVFGLFPENKVPKNLRAGDIIVRCYEP